MKLYSFHGVQAYGCDGDIEYWKLGVYDDATAYGAFLDWVRGVGCDTYRSDYGAVEEVDGYRIIVGEKVSE